MATEPVAKKAEDSPVPPFDATRGLEAFTPKEVLRFDAGGRSAVLLGEIDGKDALVALDQKAAHADADALLGALPALALTLTNHSGAEYSYYDAAAGDGGGARFSAEVIWPASGRQVQRKRPADLVGFEEDAACYAAKVAPFAAAQAGRCGWIDAVCSLEKERERNLVDAPAFVVNVDTKWGTHGAFDSDRAPWKGAPWTRDLYLLAIAKDANLRSIRDLAGPAGAALVRDMRDALRAAAADVYGVPREKVRVFFHYHPQFYRLHAHCATLQHVNPGVECDRAHLATTVASNIDLCPDYYQKATLTYKLRVGEALHIALQ